MLDERGTIEVRLTGEQFSRLMWSVWGIQLTCSAILGFIFVLVVR